MWSIKCDFITFVGQKCFQLILKLFIWRFAHNNRQHMEQCCKL